MITHNRTDAPDPRPGNYYVSVIRDRKQWSLLYGPFVRHADAIAVVSQVRAVAYEVDPWTHWDEFGTARLPDDAEPRPGVLNGMLPPIPATKD